MSLGGQKPKQVSFGASGLAALTDPFPSAPDFFLTPLTWSKLSSFNWGPLFNSVILQWTNSYQFPFASWYSLFFEGDFLWRPFPPKWLSQWRSHHDQVMKELSGAGRSLCHSRILTADYTMGSDLSACLNRYKIMSTLTLQFFFFLEYCDDKFYYRNMWQAAQTFSAVVKWNSGRNIYCPSFPPNFQLLKASDNIGIISGMICSEINPWNSLVY